MKQFLGVSLDPTLVEALRMRAAAEGIKVSPLAQRLLYKGIAIEKLEDIS